MSARAKAEYWCDAHGQDTADPERCQYEGVHGSGPCVVQKIVGSVPFAGHGAAGHNLEGPE